MRKHELPDCFGVWYNSYLSEEETMGIEEICGQGFADYYLNGINWREAKKLRKMKIQQILR